MPPVAASILAGTSAACAVGAVAARRPRVVAALIEQAHAPQSDFVLRLGRTRPVVAAAATVRLQASMSAAGWTGEPARAAALAAAGALCVVACGIAFGGAALAVAPVLALAALRSPTFIAGRAARRRTRAIERDVPVLLDVLSLAAFAGLPPPAALRRAVAVVDGPLAEEVSSALHDVELGARWRDRLARLADDVPVRDLRRTIAVLVRTESIGSRTAEPIAILADEVRAARRAEVGERARKAPVKMLFPLVFLVLPAFLLLTVVPVLVATLGSIR